MSRYFQAAENCGLRTSGEEALRLTRRTVASTTRDEVAAQAAQRATEEAERVARYKRMPDATLEVVPAQELPLASGRVRHQTSLQQAKDELLVLEGRDLDDLGQRRKVLAQQEAHLQALLGAEEEEQRAEAAREAAAVKAKDDAREQLKRELTESYGPCFLWEKEETKKKERRFDTTGLERQLEERIADYHECFDGCVPKQY